MWGKVPANNNAAYFTGHKGFIYKGIIAFFFLTLTIVIGIQPSYGNEKIIVSLALNGEARGESFAFLTEDGDFLLKVESLIDMGIPNPSGISSEIEGDTYLSLRSIKGLEFSFNENEVSLSIIIDPQLLPKNNIDMMTKRRIKSLSPEGSSLFLNYGLYYINEDSQNINDLTISNQLGARVKKVLFQADSLYTNSDSRGGFTRLGTSVTYDRIDEMQRIVLGDFVALGQLGGSVNMGGVNVSKVYLINPYHIKHPKFNISGIAKFPSEVDIYLDGGKIKSLRVPPGPFEIKNIHRYAGQGEVKIVMRDPFGKEEEYIYPLLFSEDLLGKSQHEYSYSIGKLRGNFGASNDSYGDTAISAIHRYGPSDKLTIGVGLESTDGMQVVSPELSVITGDYGIFSLTYSGSSNKDRSGNAIKFGYNFYIEAVTIGTNYVEYSEDYSNLGNLTSPIEIKKKSAFGIGYGHSAIGRYSFNYISTERHLGGDLSRSDLSYSKKINSNLLLTSRVSRILEDGSDSYELFVGVNYYPSNGPSGSMSIQYSDGINSQSMNIQKNPPRGEGNGWATYISRTESGNNETLSITPSFQHNSKYGIYRGEYQHQQGNDWDNNAFRLSASGAVASIRGTTGFTTPINDGFGLVNSSNIKDLTILVNGNNAGRTDDKGLLFLPNLTSYYDNLISAVTTDVSMEYALPESDKFASPLYRGGSYINFDVHRYSAISGKINVKMDNKSVPLEFYELTLTYEGNEIVSPAGKDGEFYFENIRPGSYDVKFDYFGKSHTINLNIPEFEGTFFDMGTMTYEIKK